MSEPIVRTAEAVAPGLYIPSSLAEIDPSSPVPPTQDELPYYDGEPLESERHFYQIILLIETLKLHWADRDDFFAGGNMFVYFSTAQVKKNDFRGPDFFVATGVDGKRERKSWVVWEEGKSPDLVIEFLSESTAAFDRGEKKKIYHDKMRVPEYFYYDPFTGELAGFITNGFEYKPMTPDQRGRLISPIIGLALVRWEGEFLGVYGEWLRLETIEGELLPTKEEVVQQARQIAERERENAEQERERAEQERERAEQERERAEQADERAEQAYERVEEERERAERLAAKLRELGVDPATLA
ncbi:MAG: Uma2 family endonuclease [Blastocatellia bacterium]